MALRWVAAVLIALGTAGGSLAQPAGFPFDRELILDVRPMPGSKRIPNMDIAANGTIALEMWCNRIEGQLVVAADTVTVVTGQQTNRQCSPEQTRRDTEALLAYPTDSAGGLINALPALRTQEAIVVGEGVNVPVRLTTDNLAEEFRPRSGSAKFAAAWRKSAPWAPSSPRSSIRCRR